MLNLKFKKSIKHFKLLDRGCVLLLFVAPAPSMMHGPDQAIRKCFLRRLSHWRSFSWKVPQRWGESCHPPGKVALHPQPSDRSPSNVYLPEFPMSQTLGVIYGQTSAILRLHFQTTAVK